jgi:hypothetical protein
MIVKKTGEGGRGYGASFDPFDKLRASKLRTGRAWGKRQRAA